jgi:hypothetical protein
VRVRRRGFRVSGLTCEGCEGYVYIYTQGQDIYTWGVYTYTYTHRVCIHIHIGPGRVFQSRYPNMMPAVSSGRVYESYSASMEITTQLIHIGHCKAAPGKNWSNRWTNRVFMMNTRRD